MNPGLVVKLRPSGPWRIGPDSGARNRVDVIYHSDSLYSAVTSAMGRLGRLEEWLDATARNAAPAVCFSSCFPFIEDVGFVVPPRTAWPPLSPSLMAAHVRWKSARFIPLEMVQSILSGERLDENRWHVDGASGCLLPAGRQGPFRTSVRWGAAVDRLSGASERHSTACIEFRPGAGLWAVAAFADDAARGYWQDAIKAAFRLLSDSGFGGERSRGWGRAETPEFIEGELPGMILGEVRKKKPVPEVAEARVKAPPVIETLEVVVADPEAAEGQGVAATIIETDVLELTRASGPGEGADAAESGASAASEDAGIAETGAASPDAGAAESGVAEGAASPDAGAVESGAAAGAASQDAGAVESGPAESAASQDAGAVETGATEGTAAQDTGAQPELVAEEATVRPPGASGTRQAHWMLSLFTPGAADTVDWARGSYSLVARGGRVDSPAGSGELKKQIQMIAEGSVLVAESAPRGAAPDVAPDGFAHPVFRAGFALAIPLPEGN